MASSLISQLLDKRFNSPENLSKIDDFLKKAGYCRKWMLYGDYCLDDAKKANNVVTFVLMPYLSNSEYKKLERKIGKWQRTDIKKTRHIKYKLLRYLRKSPTCSISFILNDRQYLLGDSDADQRKNVVDRLTEVKKGFQTWLSNASNKDIVAYYQESINKLNSQIKVLGWKKNIKPYIDIILVTYLGAYISAAFLNRLPSLDVFGWFPDRDRITSSSDNIAIPLFHYFQYNLLNAQQYQFCTLDPNSKSVPFYDVENRIPDDICGALADYNISNNKVSKDKFAEVLQALIADNRFVWVYRLYRESNIMHLGEIDIKTTTWQSIKFDLKSRIRSIYGFFKMCWNKIAQWLRDLLHLFSRMG